MRSRRRRVVVQVGVLLGALGAAGALSAQDPWPPQRRAGGELRLGKQGEVRAPSGIDAETRVRIDRGLEFLHRRQNADGSWTDRVGRKVHHTYRGVIAPHVGVTALAGMAFLASGTLPDQGARERHCEALRKALDFLMDSTGADGFISANNSRMYSHAFATLFLAEAHGSALHPDSRRLQDCLRRATRLIVGSQNKTGGWRYLPGAPDADMSITVCQVMALRAARNAGIQIPRDTIQKAVAYVKQSFMEYSPGMGAYRYQIDSDLGSYRHRYSWALTACGVTALYGAGEYSDPQVRQGLQYLWTYMPPWELARNRFDFFYGHYYAAQAAFQAGGEYWVRWYDSVKGDLLKMQAPDGSWTDLVGSSYATAMALIILQMPNQYLPITEN